MLQRGSEVLVQYSERDRCNYSDDLIWLYEIYGPVPKYQHSAGTRVPVVFHFPGDWRREFSGFGWLEGGERNPPFWA